MAFSQTAVATIVVTSVFCPIMTLAVGLRFYVRWSRPDFFALDDFAFIVALVLIWGVAGSNYTAAMADTSSEDYPMAIAAGHFTWAIAVASEKLAILSFYKRLFIYRWFVRVTYFLMAAVFAFLVSAVIVAATRCRPLRALWDSDLGEPYECANVQAGYAAVGTINVLLNFCVITLPYTVIWGLNMKTSRKILKTALYSFGWASLLFSILRVISLSDPAQHNSGLGQTFLIWSVLEPSVGLTANCIPVIRRVIPCPSLRQRSSHNTFHEPLRRISSGAVSGARHNSQRQQSTIESRDRPASPMDITALPPVHSAPPTRRLPFNVIYMSRGRGGGGGGGGGEGGADRRPRTTETMQTTESVQPPLPAFARHPFPVDTPTSTPRHTRRHSLTSDAGMFTHWRPDEEGEELEDV